MSLKKGKDLALIDSLNKLLVEQDFAQHQTFILSLSEELGVSVLESTAALLYYNNINITLNAPIDDQSLDSKVKPELSIVHSKQKRVRYRLEVGRKHQILLEEIKDILVDVSGVERSQIGRMDIRNHYTLVDLPHGMPADIFQLLSETEMQHQKLNIKRVKQHRRNHHQPKKIKKRHTF